jgi:hypothetical protein
VLKYPLPDRVALLTWQDNPLVPQRGVFLLAQLYHTLTNFANRGGLDRAPGWLPGAFSTAHIHFRVVREGPGQKPSPNKKKNQMSIVFSRPTNFLVEPGSLASMSSMTAVIRCRFDGLKNSLKAR